MGQIACADKGPQARMGAGALAFDAPMDPGVTATPPAELPGATPEIIAPGGGAAPLGSTDPTGAGPENTRYLAFHSARRPHGGHDRQTPDKAYFNQLQPIPAAGQPGRKSTDPKPGTCPEKPKHLFAARTAVFDQMNWSGNALKVARGVDARKAA